MKKILSYVLALLMVLSVFILPASAEFAPTADKFTQIPRGSDVIARFVVGSDIHLEYGDSVSKLENAYAVMKKFGGVDAFIAAGDLTDNGTADQLATFQRIVAANTKNLTVEVDGFKGTGAGSSGAVGTTIAMLGNHEYYNANIETDFREQVGQETDMIYWLNGKVPVIKVSMGAAVSGRWPSSFETKHDFIESAVKEVAATGYKGHIFLISHIAFGDTVFGSEAKGDDRYLPETEEFLKNYPQIVHVSAHSHADPSNPGVIDQSAGFTSIVTGSVGKWFRQSESSGYGSSFTMFDVKSDGTTELYRVDLSAGKIIAGSERWILDSAQGPEDFIYFNDPAKATNKNAYALKGNAPVYGKNVTVTAKDLGNKDSVEVSFTANATAASEKNYDYVECYTAKATPVKGGKTIEASIYNDPSLKGGETLSVKLYGLEYDTDYEISVVAETAFGVESTPVKAKNTVNVGSRGEMPALKTLYCVDYSHGSGDEIKGHAGKTAGSVKIVEDEDIGKMAASFRGFGIGSYTFDISDVDRIRYNYTLEAYFKLTDTTPFQQIVNISGLDIAIQAENGMLKAYNSVVADLDSHTVCNVPIEAGEWIHTVLTYDGKKAYFYVNGELAAEKDMPGGLSASSDGDNELFRIGGIDTSSDTLAKDSRVNMVSLSEGVMTADEVKAAYAARTAKIPAFSDVNSTDWYYHNVRYAVDSGLMNGTGGSLFAPATETSRAMIVQMLYNMEGRPAVEYKPTFTDVAEGAWYADAVIWAYESGVTSGSSATTFSPDALVTREQLAVFLFRYLRDYKKADVITDGDLSSFPDAGSISPYTDFKEAVQWATGEGIITGKTKGDTVVLAPTDRAQRCETATIFARFHKIFVR